MGIRGVQFKKGKSCHHQNGSPFPSYCFLGPRWLPSQLMLKGQDHGFWREVVWREGQEQPPASSHPPSKRKGRFSTGSLNVNHGGVSLLHSSSVSLHFSWSWPQSEWRVSYWMYWVPIFKGEKSLKQGKMKENMSKKYIIKNTYIYIYTQIIYINIYIYTQRNHKRDWGRPWRQGAGATAVPL